MTSSSNPSRRSIGLALLLALLPSLPLLAESPPINGLAHIAVAVGNIERSRDFYRKLGFEEAFHFGEDTSVTQSFLKINDTQFIELYPATPKQPAGFVHLCFEGDDLNALHASYIARGLSPIPVGKARAGNLLFTMEGPEGQNIEYTQYLPGSLHFDDHGRHLGDHRVSPGMFAVALAMRDREAARTYYVDRLAFIRVSSHPWLLEIPGKSHQQILLETVESRPHATAFFHVSDVEHTKQELKRLGLPVITASHAVSVTDPDGNLLVFQSSPEAFESKP